MQDITIKVEEAGTAAARTLTYDVQVDGISVSESSLTPVQSQQVREIGYQYFSLQQGGGRGQAESYLPILSNSLSSLFLEKGEQKWREGIAPGARLVVASSIPEVLQLPWELLRLSPKMPQEECPFSVVRRPIGAATEGPAPKMPPLSAGPLRLLFLSAGPMDWEEEERSILQVAEGLKLEIAFCESGTVEELKALAEQFQPHLLHLAVQAKMNEGSATITLPGRAGRPESIKAEDLVAALKACAPAGVVLCAPQSASPAGLHIFCQRLSEKIPLALAWDASGAQARTLYAGLSAGQAMEDALLSLAREGIGSSGKGSSRTSFPAVYSSDEGGVGPLVDASLRMAATEVLPCQGLLPLPGLAEGGAECFVGRRKEIERLYPALADGSLHTLIITGPEGSGKSALAVRLARLMAGSGYAILPLYSSSHNPITWARVVEAVTAYLSASGQEGLADDLRKAAPLKERLKRLVDALKSSRMLLLWDGLETGPGGRIPDPDLSQLYMMMIRGTNASRSIITCRSLPAEALTLPARAWQWKTEGLSQASFVRHLLCHPATARRYCKGEISFAALAEHHLISSGLPRHLAQTGAALGQGDIPPGGNALAALASYLDRASFAALCRAAVYEISVSSSGLAAVCSLTEEQTEAESGKWHRLSLAHKSGVLWRVPSSLRADLLADLSEEQRQSAHKSAAGFLKRLAESGGSASLSLSRLDVLLEARGHYIAAEDWEAAAALTGRISGYLRGRGYYSEIIRLNRELLDLGASSSGAAAWIGQAHLDREEYRGAEEWFGRALQISPDPVSYQGLGLSLMHREKYDQARDSLEKAAASFRAAGDSAGEAGSLSSLAAIDMKKGDRDAAQEKLERIAEIMKVRGDAQGEAAALQETARLEMMASNYDAARQRLQRSLELLRASEDRRGAAFALFNLASLDLERGDFQAAGEEYALALPLFHEMGDRAGVAAILHSQGLIQTQAGEKEQAGKSFREALSINQELGDRAAEAGSFFQLGALAVQQERMAEGLRLMALAAIVLRSIKSEEVKSVEPLVERLAAQLNYSQEQFMAMVQEVLNGYAKDRGRGLVQKAFGEPGE